MVAVGIVLVLAVWLDQVRRRSRSRRWAPPPTPRNRTFRWQFLAQKENTW